MKIVVMSDTHLTRVTAAFDAICAKYCADADLVIHQGDMASFAILDFLEQYPLEAVAGNMDDFSIRHRLPANKIIRIKDYRVGIVHGWGGSVSELREKLRQVFAGVDAILFGHTHQPLQIEDDGCLWFNPGSVFLGRGSHPQTLGILHIEDSIRSEIVQL